MKKNNLIKIGVLAVISALSACGGGSSESTKVAPPVTPNSTITPLKTISVVQTTIALNGDANPYGLTTPPASYTGLNAAGGKNLLQPGDILISNFSDKTGANFGTSIMRFVPSTNTISQYYQETLGKGPVAIALSSLGALWIANFQPRYTSAITGVNTGDGNVVVVNPNGIDFPNNVGLIDNNSGATFNPTSDQFAGPWGQVFAVKDGSKTPFFFVTQVGTGVIQRQQFVAGNFKSEMVTTIGKLPFGVNAFDPTGPQGLAYDSATDTLYVSSTADNSIVAFPNATTIATTEAAKIIYKGGPLNAPVGLALSPTNGDLLVVNQLDNNLLEIKPNLDATSAASFSGSLVATKLLDTTPVDPVKGTGSGLFSILPVKDDHGNLQVYFVDSITNSLNILK